MAKAKAMEYVYINGCNDIGLDKFRLIKELQEELFVRTGQAWFRVVSGSMRPLIEISDRILVERIPLQAIRTRDIILFRHDAEGIMVSHRVLRIIQQDGKTYLLQKGDAGLRAGVVDAQQIMGRVVAIERQGRLIDLSRGWPRAINILFGLKNWAFYGVEGRFHHLKNQLRETPLRVLRWPYRAIKLPMARLGRATLRRFLR